MWPENKEDFPVIALRLDIKGYWKVRGAGSYVRPDGTSDDLKDENGSCWFVMDFEDGGVRLRTKANGPSGDHLYLGLIEGMLIADDSWDEKPLFIAMPQGDSLRFQAANGAWQNYYLGWVNEGATGDVIGAREDQDDEYCLFATVQPQAS